MVVFDATILILLLNDEADAPTDPAGLPIDHPRARIEFLVQTLHKSGTKILIPTPVLAEVLVQSGAAGLEYVKILQRAAVFRVEDFDTRAAVELAAMTREAVDGGGGKKSGVAAPWQLIKIDRQIVAIARVAGAKTLYTTDEKLAKFADLAKLKVIGLHEMPLPELAAQMDMHAAFEAARGEPDDAEVDTSDDDAQAEEEPSTSGDAPP